MIVTLFLEEIIANPSLVSSSKILDSAVDKYCYTVKSDESSKLRIMLKCVEHIKNNQSVLSNIKILESILESYYPFNSNYLNYSSYTNYRHKIVQALIQENSLIEVLTQNITLLKKHTHSRLAECRIAANSAE